MKNLISIAFMQMVCVMLNAQQIQFAQSYINSGENSAIQFVQLPDSGFMLVGFTSPVYPATASTMDATLIRLNKFGDTLFVKKFTQDNHIGGIAIYDDSTIMLNGGFHYFGSLGINISKLTFNGDTLWVKYYGTSFTEVSGIIRKTMDNCFITMNFSSWSHGLIKIDSAGNELWHMSNNTGFELYDIEMDPFGGYIGVGTNGGGIQSYNAQYIKPNGQRLWQKDYGNNLYPNVQPAAWDVTIANDSNFLVACDGYDWHLMKLNRLTGDTMWVKLYPNLNFNSVAIENIGNGKYALFTYLYLLIIDDVGDILYQMNEPFYPNLTTWQVKKTSDGGFAMCGKVRNFGAGYISIAFVKFDSLGNTQYTSIFNPYNNMQPVFIYPSLANASINFALPSEFKNSTSVLFIFDLNGQKIISESLGNQQTININQLPNGLYIAELRNAKGDKVVRQKVVVQH